MLSLWIGHRIYKGNRRSRSKVYSLVRFAIPAIALSMAVMLLSVSIIEGFRHSVCDTIRLVTGDLIISEYGKQPIQLDNRVRYTPEIEQTLRQVEGVESIRPIRLDAGMIKTDTLYEGVALIGVGSDRDTIASPTHEEPFAFLLPLLYEGMLTNLPDTLTSPPLVLPRITAQRMGLSIGDKVILYFLSSHIDVRAFTLVATLELTNTAQPLAYLPTHVLKRIAHWDENVYSRIEIVALPDTNDIALSERVITALSHPGVTDQELGVYAGSEINRGVYEWIASLDPNAWTLLVLMALVAAFTMINALLIIILDMTQTIGTLQALGMSRRNITLMVLSVALRIILWGMLWGNILALAIALSQLQWQWLQLDPNTYYISYVSMIIRPGQWFAINLSTLAICLLLMLLPAQIISRITPSSALRFD